MNKEDKETVLTPEEMIKKFINEKSIEYNLNTHTERLMMNEPFFSSISRRVTKRPNIALLAYAGIGINPKTLQLDMFFNPVLMSILSDRQKAAVIKHEFYHVIFSHLTSRMLVPKNNANLMKKWNCATDLAINSFIKDEIPENMLLPGRKPFENLKLGKSSEYYYNQITDEQVKQVSGDGRGKGQGCQDGEEDGESCGFDDHSGWSDRGDVDESMVKERIKQILSDAAKQATCKSWGSVSSSVKREVERIISAPLVNWRNVLRYFIKNTVKAYKHSSIRVINKRYPYIHAGKRYKRQANIAISFDQSGSVGDDLIKIFFNELSHLAKFANFTFIPFDYDVNLNDIFIWKKGTQCFWKRVKCGGTNFNAPTDYVNERNFDGHIILTDMEAEKPKVSKCQRIWVVPEVNKQNPYFKTNELIIGIPT